MRVQAPDLEILQEEGNRMSRILIVDDDEAMRRLFRLSLEDAFEIIDTGDAHQASALPLQHKPAAVLPDFMMPESSRFELFQTLVSLSFTQQIPILIVSE